MEVNYLKQILERRKSTYPKDYTGKPIAQELVNELIFYAKTAPNHKKTAPWRFRVFIEDDLLNLGKKLQEIYQKETLPEQFSQKKYDDIISKISKTGAIISIGVHYSKKVPDWEELAAVSMAVQNMYLLANAYGLGCYWSSPKFIKMLPSYLKMEENQDCIGLFYLGRLD